MHHRFALAEIRSPAVRPRNFRTVLWLVSLAATLAGCAGDGPGTGSQSQFDTLQREIFNVSCVSGVCHNSQTQAGGLNLAPGVSYAQLVGVESDNIVARQQGLLRVEPFSPGQSFLVRKVTDPGFGEGSLMPLGESPLSAAQIQMIVDWIEAGAPAGDDPTPTGTSTAVFTATATETPEPTSTPTATETEVPTATATATAVPPTVTGTVPPSPTPTESPVPSATPTVTETATVTETPTVTPSPTITPTLTIAPGSTLPELQADIFTPRCAVLGCHDDESAPFNGDLSLQDGSTYGQTVGVQPQNLVARNAGQLRVDPGVPQNSFLLGKVIMPGPGEGSPMPLIGDPLTADQIERIRAWITRGALPNE